MPEFEFTWRRDNPPHDGVEQEPTLHIGRSSGSTSEKARKKLETAFYPGELDGFTLSVQELDEDGDPV